LISQISFPAMLLLLLLAGSLAHSLTRGSHGNAEMLFSLVMWLEGMMSIGGFSLEARLTLVGVMQSTCIRSNCALRSPLNLPFKQPNLISAPGRRKNGRIFF